MPVHLMAGQREALADDWMKQEVQDSVELWKPMEYLNKGKAGLKQGVESLEVKTSLGRNGSGGHVKTLPGWGREGLKTPS